MKPNYQNALCSLASDAERDRCLAIAADLFECGPGFPCSTEFADGYSLAAQELVAGIAGNSEPFSVEEMQDLCNKVEEMQDLCNKAARYISDSIDPLDAVFQETETK